MLQKCGGLAGEVVHATRVVVRVGIRESAAGEEERSWDSGCEN